MAEDFTSLTSLCPLVTNERLDKALTNWFNEDYTFTQWEYVNNTEKGNGLQSEIIPIKLHGVNDNGYKNFIQVVLKCMPSSVARKLTFRTYDFFKNEFSFYETVLPGLLSFQTKKEVKEPFRAYTKLVFAYSDSGNNDIISFEDAHVEGFIPAAVTLEGVDLEHCKLTLKAYAQFHAISFAMKDQEPDKFEILRNAVSETYFDDKFRGWYAKFWERISGIAADAVEKEYPNSIYVDKIKQFVVPERFQDLINAATKTAETGVISHGDAWINNFMFKYVDGHAVDAKLIDFQMTRCATPVLDLSYLIYTCTSQNLREQYYDDLLKFYHDTLSSQIRELGSDPSKLYSWELFMSEIKKYSLYGLAFSFEAIPVIVMTPDDSVNMTMEGDQPMDMSDAWPLGNIKTKEGRLKLADIAKHCVDRGYI